MAGNGLALTASISRCLQAVATACDLLPHIWEQNVGGSNPLAPTGLTHRKHWPSTRRSERPDRPPAGFEARRILRRFPDLVAARLRSPCERRPCSALDGLFHLREPGREHRARLETVGSRREGPYSDIAVLHIHG